MTNLRDLYGRCSQMPCPCLRLDPWPGRACPHWTPLGPETQEELAQLYKTDPQRVRMFARKT